MHFYKQYFNTGNSIREVEAQAKKELSTQHNCEKQLIPNMKPSTSSAKVNMLIKSNQRNENYSRTVHQPSNRDRLQLLDVSVALKKKSKASSVMTPHSPVKPFTTKIFADSSQSRGLSKKRIDDGGPVNSSLAIDSHNSFLNSNSSYILIILIF